MRPVQIAVYDGIVMGGGVGISAHAPIKIATENAMFAMPETLIGLFPDVGGSFILPRLEKSLGLYLGIMGSKLVGQQLVQGKIADFFVLKQKLPDLKDYLIENVSQNSSVEEIQEMTGKFAQEIEEPLANIDCIERCFSNVNSAQHIYHKLDEDESKWAKATIESLEKLCPISIKVVYEQLKRGKSLSLEEVFLMEYRISQNFMNGVDFFEGVRASLIDKDKSPKWSHESIFDVPDDQIKAYFEKPFEDFRDLDVVAELKKLNNQWD